MKFSFLALMSPLFLCTACQPKQASNKTSSEGPQIATIEAAPSVSNDLIIPLPKDRSPASVSSEENSSSK